MMSSRAEYPRELCLEKISQEAGEAFGFGVACSAFVEFIAKSYNSRTGLRESFIAGTRAARINTPGYACNVTAASVLAYSIEHSACYVRQKEDPWNSIMGSFAFGGVIGMGLGPREMAVSAILMAALDGSLTIVRRFGDRANS